VNVEIDVPPTGREEFGVVNSFRVGTRLYLTLPTGERVGYTFAPVQQTVNGVTFYTPAFTPDPSPLTPNLWTLSADSTKLTKAGDRFFDFQTGEAYNPTNPILADAQFKLTATDGTIYKIHAVNGITEQQFTDGKKFILSDSGITALNGESVQFSWTTLSTQHSALASVTGPDGHRIVYTYDQQGNLVSARDLITGDTSRYGYDAQGRLALVTETGQPGQVISYAGATPQTSTIKTDLGAALTYLATPFYLHSDPWPDRSTRLQRAAV
jgi:YD repeat-containing protein